MSAILDIPDLGCGALLVGDLLVLDFRFWDVALASVVIIIAMHFGCFATMLCRQSDDSLGPHSDVTSLTVIWHFVSIAFGEEMKLLTIGLSALALASQCGASSCNAEEISLFSTDGSAVAYVDTEDEATIYLWGGEPVAYIAGRDSDDLNVWGFNGKHLGWFKNGAIWDRSGGATCATKEVLAGFAKFEPLKTFKQFKPFKSIQEFVPFQPFFTGRFGSNSCSLYLAQGSK